MCKFYSDLLLFRDYNYPDEVQYYFGLSIYNGKNVVGIILTRNMFKKYMLDTYKKFKASGAGVDPEVLYKK